MDYLYSFIVRNFVLLCVSVVLGVTLIRHRKSNNRVRLWLFLIIGLALTISIGETIKDVVQIGSKNILGTTILASLLYVMRPFCIILFIFLSGQEFKGAWIPLLVVPMVLNIISSLFPFFEPTAHFSFYYTGGETVKWNGGDYFIFRYMPHLVSAFYLILLLIRTFSLVKKRHFLDATSLLVCAVVVCLATIIETFFNDNGDVYLLSSSIGISAAFYHLFLYERASSSDALTGLFDRATYFDDMAKMSKDITGIIQLDMNGLKYLNDNYGHLEGDKGLITVANAIKLFETPNMYSYRVGGDEFIVLVVRDGEASIRRFIDSFREELGKTHYYCSIGYSIRKDYSITIDKLLKESEALMYKDKSEFYKKSNIERRKVGYIEE
ncbi:MAG: GGDEF domain-containing protein [Bacilli bacterium]|nr:GGDEF domain-containing protein [Bacilli bacterium]